MQLVLQERCLACLVEAQPIVPQMDLAAVGIQEDQLVQTQAVGNLLYLAEVAQERVFPCLLVQPLVDQPLPGLPSVDRALVDQPLPDLSRATCLLGVTVVETCGVA